MKALSALAEWDNFYVIVGSSAAGLTGLTFVVIALTADAQRTNPIGLRAFITPTIVHFSSVLVLAAFLSVPHQIVLSLSLGLGAAGVAGLGYVVFIAAAMRRNASDYAPVLDDLVWHLLLPTLCYGALLTASLIIWNRTQISLCIIAAVSMLLLLIGVHNAWDIAVWVSVRRGKDKPQQPS